MSIRSLVLIQIILIAVTAAIAQPNADTSDPRHFERLAIKAYQEKDLAAYLANMQAADRLSPNHPRITYNLASAYAVNGRRDDAIAALKKIASMGLYYALERDDDFKSLADIAEYRKILETLAANRLPFGKGERAYTIAERGLVPESIAFDPQKRAVFISSVAKRRIMRRDASGSISVFADDKTGLWSVLGIKIDAKRRHIWATTAAMDETPDLKAPEKGSSAIIKFDIDKGTLLERYELPADNGRHVLGDLVIAANGDVYATDSVSPAIYVIRRSSNKIEQFVTSQAFASPQGLDITPDGKYIVMADYARGLFRIDLRTSAITKFTVPANMTAQGIDGLYVYKNSVIATQNGVNPQRVIRVFFDRSFSRVTGYKILLANDPAFDEITLGSIVGSRFLFIANSQWGMLGPNGKLAQPEKLVDILVMSVELGR